MCIRDRLLWPPVEAADKIEELISSGEIPMSRLEDALERIGRMEDFRDKSLKNHSYDTPDARFVDEKLLEITRDGICQLRNKIGLLPIEKEKYHHVPVSYTHLDVYKRQPLFCLMRLRRRIQMYSTCFFKFLTMDA